MLILGVLIGIGLTLGAFLGGVWYQVTFKQCQGVLGKSVGLMEKVSRGKPMFVEPEDVDISGIAESLGLEPEEQYVQTGEVSGD